MSGRSPPVYCTFTLITMHSHQSYHNITTVIHSYKYSSTTVDNSTIETYRNRGLGKYRSSKLYTSVLYNLIIMQGYCTNTEYTGSLADGCFKEKSNQMYPVMGEKQMSKRVRWDQRVGSKVAKILKKSERYITSRNGWVSLKGIFRWYICRRDPSTYQNTPGPSGHTNV